MRIWQLLHKMNHHITNIIVITRILTMEFYIAEIFPKGLSSTHRVISILVRSSTQTATSLTITEPRVHYLQLLLEWLTKAMEIHRYLTISESCS